jgi:hypothetical protein
VALPGHNTVGLTWTNPSGDTTFAGVEIRRVAWGDYPEYGTPGPAEPSYPANETEGVLVVQTSAEAFDDSITTRDIYYYSAFAYDSAGNYSAFDTAAKDHSTNYWLGDINPAMTGDGNVGVLDLATFSLSFGEVQGGQGWNNEVDIGPTDDFFGTGIPTPDDRVDFEDLMIVSLNYGASGPAALPPLALAAEGRLPLTDLVSFELIPTMGANNTMTVAVVVENAAAVLKGFSLTLDYGMGNDFITLESGESLSRDVFVGKLDAGAGRVMLCVSAVGAGKPLLFSGEVARLTFRSKGGSDPVRLAKIDLRDLVNNREEVEVDEPIATPFIPTVSALMQNHPNPFNPTTTITFDVATAGVVNIDIYDVTGRRVRTLAEGHKDVGRHTVIWDARNMHGTQVRTGVYFYRMTAPGYRSTAKKMLLLK